MGLNRNSDKLVTTEREFWVLSNCIFVTIFNMDWKDSILKWFLFLKYRKYKLMETYAVLRRFLALTQSLPYRTVIYKVIYKVIQ